MVFKTLSRHTPSYGSLIQYILKESKHGEHEPIIFTNNLRSHDAKEWERQFIENEAFRLRPRSDQIYMHHEIIGFSNEDTEHITDEALIDLGNEYMRLRGKEGVYMGAVHRDTDNVHIHFAVSSLKFRTGQAHRMSRNDLHELKVKLQEYQRERYPEISKSIVEHGKGKAYVTDREWQAKHRTGRALLKEEIEAVITKHFKQSKTQKEFLEALRAEGLFHYERNGIPTGVVHGDIKFRFSRLGISKEEFNQLPQDLTKEQKTLAEIKKLRKAMHRTDREDIDFER